MVSSKFEGESFQRSQTVNMIFIKKGTIPKSYNLYNIKLYFCFSYLYISLAGNIIVYTPNQGTNRGKNFYQTIYQRKDANSGGKKTPFHPFLPSRTASFPSFDRKGTGPIRRKWTSKWLFPRRHHK